MTGCSPQENDKRSMEHKLEPNNIIEEEREDMERRDLLYIDYKQFPAVLLAVSRSSVSQHFQRKGSGRGSPSSVSDRVTKIPLWVNVDFSNGNSHDCDGKSQAIILETIHSALCLYVRESTLINCWKTSLF